MQEKYQAGIRKFTFRTTKGIQKQVKDNVSEKYVQEIECLNQDSFIF